MFKRFIKKHNKKIIAFIGVLATTICGVFGITKTYAYNTNGNTAITTTLDQFVNGFYNLEYKTIERNGQTKPYMELQLASVTYNILDFTTSFLGSEDDELVNDYVRDYSLLMNYQYGYYDRYTSEWKPIFDTSHYYEFSMIYNNNITLYSRSTYFINSDSYDSDFMYSYRTSILMYNSPNINTSLFNDDTTFRLRLRSPQYSSTSYYLRIYSIDMVRDDKITLTKYYSSLQEQLTQLQNQYDTLEDNYNDLQDDYDTLENDYETLENNYNSLQTEYNELSDDYRNLYFNTNYGIWNFLSYEIVTLNNPIYSPNETETYRYEGYTHWVKDDIIELNKLNVTKAITRNFIAQTPPFTIECDDWNINMHFSVYNHPAYIYYQLPTDTLDLQFDTNINFNNYVDINTSNYILFIITLSNYDNYTTGNYITLPISMDFFNRFGFRITKENLQEEFSQYDLNYYNNVMSIFISSNYKLNTEDKFDIISTNAVIDRDYQLGYADGRASMDDTISGLRTEVASLKGEITNMQLTINSLNEQLNSTANDYNLNNLIWTIGGTPFESFKHIWNVNFFGVNVADFILGFITTFLGLFIFKKFFF